MTEVEPDFTAQGLPMVRLNFDAEIDGEAAVGSFYVISAGSQAYVLLVAGTVDEFTRYAEQAQTVVDSLNFDSSLIAYTQAGAEPTAYADADQLLSLTLPPGWFASDTGDDQLPVIVMNPDINYVMMLSTDATLGTEFDMSTEGLFDTEDGQPDPALLDELTSGLADMLGTTDEDLTFDPEKTQTFPREGGLVIRMVGEGDFGEGATAPVAFYFDLRDQGGALGILVGEVDPALADEQTLLDLIMSVNTGE